jgi:hypothetical protein
MRIIAMLAFMTAAVAFSSLAKADSMPTEMSASKDTCYRLTHNYRVRHIKCNQDRWPNTEFEGRDSSQYSLSELLDLGARFQDLNNALKNIFK